MSANPLSLQLYLALSWLVPPLARVALKRRLARGKEDPQRWHEKLGQASCPRPEGRLIWLNAVGLGEVLSLRGLISALTAQGDDINVLVTSTTRDSAAVFAKELPERTVHQFLPIDAPQFRRRFLDHWRPDVAIWVEQDLWPGMVADLEARNIPQAIVAARMDAASFRARTKWKALFAALYQRMAMVTAQDSDSQKHLLNLGAPEVEVTKSLKPATPALAVDQAAFTDLKAQLGGRPVWVAASTYPEDEAVAVKAHETLRQTVPDALLIIVPRQVSRDFTSFSGVPRWSKGEAPHASDPIWLADSVGEMGLFLRLAQSVLIGGTFNEIEGHNPWEAVVLGCSILNGPHTRNFKSDFQELDKAGISKEIGTAKELASALSKSRSDTPNEKAQALVAARRKEVAALAKRLVALTNG